MSSSGGWEVRSGPFSPINMLSEQYKENILIAFGVEPENDKYDIANGVVMVGKNEENWEKRLKLKRIYRKLVTLPINSCFLLIAKLPKLQPEA
jgi:hypothetical protein